MRYELGFHSLLIVLAMGLSGSLYAGDEIEKASCREVLAPSKAKTLGALADRWRARDTLFQQLLFGGSPAPTPPRTRNFFQRAGRFGKNLGVFGIRSVAHMVSPLDISVMTRPASYAVFKRLERDRAWRDYVLTHDDWWWKLDTREMEAVVPIRNFQAHYLRRARYLDAYPKAFAVKAGVDYGFQGLRYVVYGSALVLIGIEISEGIASTEEILEPLADDEIQLIDETLPFPHLAIRIGDRVYSYGTNQVSITPARIYLDSRFASEIEGKRPGWLARNRAVHVATLKLDPSEVSALRRHLELQNGKIYRNLTLINDCSTMIVRAIESHTSVRIGKAIDPSPTAVMASFAYRKAAGDPIVKKVQLVRTDPNVPDAVLYARAAWIGILEGRLFYESYLLNTGVRGIFDHRFGPDEIQNYGELVKGQIHGIRREVIAEYEDEPEISSFLRQSGNLSPQQRAEFDPMVRGYFRGLYEANFAILADPHAEFFEIYEAGYRVLALEDLERRITHKAQLDARAELKRRVRDPEFATMVLDE